jgi:hypothetical protein
MHTEKLNIVQTRARELRADLDVLGPPQIMAALFAEIHSFADATNITLGGLKDELSASYAADYSKWNGVAPPDKKPAEGARWTVALRAAGAAAVILEACFAAILAALTFNLQIVAAATVGVFMTAAITLIFKAAWRAFTSDESRPRKSVNLLLKHLLIVFPMWLLCLTGVLFIGRILTEATPFANLLFGSLVTILTVLSPALAAILLTLDGQWGWQRNYVNQWRKIDEIEMGVLELEQYAGAVERRLFGVPRQTAHGPRDGGRGVGASAVALFVVLWGVGLGAAECRNQVWVDYTGSVSSVGRQEALNRSLALLPHFAESECGSTWEFLGFAGAAILEASFYTVNMPQLSSGGCTVQARTSEMSKLFRAPAQAAEVEQRRACDKIRQSEHDAYQAAIDAQINQVRERAEGFKALDPGRTCIIDLLDRLGNTHETIRRILILTDGAENCTAWPRASIPAPGTRTVTAMIILSQQSLKPTTSPAQYYARVKGYWLKIAPWVRVYPPYGINEEDLGSAFGLVATGPRLGPRR